MKTMLVAAALAAALASAPADAKKRRDVPVPVADLDLGTKEGVAALDRRLTKAAARACGTAYYLDDQALEDIDRCRADALGRARAYRDVLVRRAQAAQSASAAALRQRWSTGT